MPAGTVTWGVRFWPGAGPALLQIEPASLRNVERVLDQPWAAALAARLARADAEDEAARAWEEVLSRLLADAHPLDGPVMAAAGTLWESGGRVPVEELAAQVGLSPRQLRRRFRAAVGLSPKELARALRARAAMIGALEDGGSWAQVAARFGYADEAHLSRELRRVGGLSPAALRRHLVRINHGTVRR